MSSMSVVDASGGVIVVTTKRREDCMSPKVLLGFNPIDAPIGLG